ncbi:MAG: hypothetical protein R3343_11880 [Nitriliruptorales bacterium]|nr:hypothetical protein [Nitriliruptorales bacterium]
MRSPAFLTAASIAVFAVILTGCGGTADAADAPGGEAPIAGACHVDHPDCVDTGVDPEATPDDLGDEFPVDDAESAAQSLLGATESDLSDDVRIARRGDESFMLTEDYVIGRMTVELDDRDGVYVVTAVTVELPEGPVTFRD